MNFGTHRVSEPQLDADRATFPRGEAVCDLIFVDAAGFLTPDERSLRVPHVDGGKFQPAQRLARAAHQTHCFRSTTRYESFPAAIQRTSASTCDAVRPPDAMR